MNPNSPDDHEPAKVITDRISLVVASYNSASMLRETLAENVKTPFAAIVIVDGDSDDDTAELVKELKKQNPGRFHLHSAPKKGLANARNIGTSQVRTEYAMHAGPDNVFTTETVAHMMSDLRQNDLVSCQTRLLHVNGYLDRVHNLYKKRHAPGPRDVVGTPYLAKTSLFQEFPYNENMLNSDDTELCERLRAAGKKIYRSEAVCLEVGFNRLRDIRERWTRWGRGDSLFHDEMSAKWSFTRKIMSWLWTFRAEMTQPAGYLTLAEYLYTLPFLIMVCFLRYFGRIRHVLFRR